MFQGVGPQDDYRDAGRERDDGGEEFALAVLLAMIIAGVLHVSSRREVQDESDNDGDDGADYRDRVREPVRHQILDVSGFGSSCLRLRGLLPRVRNCALLQD